MKTSWSLVNFLAFTHFIACRDFYLGMFRRNDFLVAQDVIYKASAPFGYTTASYGRFFKCPITYFRVVDRLGQGRGPFTTIVRGGLRKKFISVRIKSTYRLPVSVNIYVGCENKKQGTFRSTTHILTTTPIRTDASIFMSTTRILTTTPIRTDASIFMSTTRILTTTPIITDAETGDAATGDAGEVTTESGGNTDTTPEEELVTEKEEVMTEKEVMTENEEAAIEKEEVVTEKEEAETEQGEVVTGKEEVVTEKAEVVTEKEEVLTEKEEVVTDKEEVVTEKEKT